MLYFTVTIVETIVTVLIFIYTKEVNDYFQIH